MGLTGPTSKASAVPSRTNVAVILAGGIGSRVGLEIPKQLVKLAGKTILEHTLLAIHSHDQINEILVIMPHTHLAEAPFLGDRVRYPKIKALLAGGRTRNESTQVAIDFLGNRDCNVLLHDAVRPFITTAIISSCIAALTDFEAVDTGIPSADTIIEVDEENFIREIPSRSSLRRGQTPQAFRLSTIRDAYIKANQDPNFAATDDCTVVLRYLPETKVKVVDGDVSNMKVTEPIDLFIADKLFQLRTRSYSNISIESPELKQLMSKVLVVFGASYGIGADVVSLAKRYGAKVHGFSRSGTNTSIENQADIDTALAEVLVAEGHIDYVVITAATLDIGPLSDKSADDILDAALINLVAPAVIARKSHPHLAKTQGHILFFTSSSYTRGRANYSLYSATKAAIVNLTQALADEWESDRIRVNCINPERTATPMRSKAFGDEAPGTLLSSKSVAVAALKTLITQTSGEVVDIRLSSQKL